MAAKTAKKPKYKHPDDRFLQFPIVSFRIPKAAYDAILAQSGDLSVHQWVKDLVLRKVGHG